MSRVSHPLLGLASALGGLGLACIWEPDPDYVRDRGSGTVASSTGMLLGVSSESAIEASESGSTSVVDGSGESGSSSGDGSTTTADGGSTAEICDGLDNDGDGFVDEFSSDNADCNGCALSEFGGRTFWLCREARVWVDARDACEDLGAVLSRPDSVALTVHISETIDGIAFAGGSDVASEGDWVWTDGSPIGAQTWWKPSEPNNYSNQDCMVLWPDQAILDADASWDDWWCDVASGYVCEGRI